MTIPKYILPLLVFNLFSCVSLWFASNAVMDDLVLTYHLGGHALANLTSAVQVGFITGTLLFAILSFGDRFPPSKFFFTCALFGAVFNLGIIWDGNTMWSLILLRFLLGIALAGIYPIAMKIATDYYNKDLGKSLGFIVGALALGTSFPHLLKAFTSHLPWKVVLIATSSIATFGGLLMLTLVPKGPFYSVSGNKTSFSSFFTVFKNKPFRSAAIGYFGHMWELYAFWAFVPFVLTAYNKLNPTVELDISIYSFIIISVGWIGCVISGYASINIGAKKTASIVLLLSILFCLFSPFLFSISTPVIFISLLIIWGMVVLADSPMFSTLVSKNVVPEAKGTALTIVTCIGFSITILSIQLLTYLSKHIEPQYLFLPLIIGPVLGLFFLQRDKN